MPVQFIGDVSWQQAEDELWSVDSFGVDHCSVLYRGGRLLKPAFEDFLQKQRWTVMTGFAGMRLANWNGVQMTPNFPGIQISFLGFRSGVVPPVKITDSKITQSATGQGNLPNQIVESGGVKGGGASVTGSFVYQASRTTYTWFTNKPPPKDSPYNTVSDTRDPLKSIIQYNIQFTDSLYPTIVPYSAFVAVFNKLIRRVFVSDYVREQLIPGELWACQASVDYQVIN